MQFFSTRDHVLHIPSEDPENYSESRKACVLMRVLPSWPVARTPNAEVVSQPAKAPFPYQDNCEANQGPSWKQSWHAIILRSERIYATHHVKARAEAYLGEQDRTQTGFIRNDCLYVQYTEWMCLFVTLAMFISLRHCQQRYKVSGVAMHCNACTLPH